MRNLFRRKLILALIVAIVSMGFVLYSKPSTAESRSSTQTEMASSHVPQEIHFSQLAPNLRKFLSPVLYSRDPNLLIRYANWYRELNCQGEECVVNPNKLAEFIFDNDLSFSQKVSVACVTSKVLEAMPFLHFQNQVFEHILVAGELASMEVSLKSGVRPEKLRSYLMSHGFGIHAGASLGHLWGLRSNKAGAELHWEQDKGAQNLNIHIDLNNPGVDVSLSGLLEHMQKDLWNRRDYYDPGEVVRRTGRNCGFDSSSGFRSN